MHCDSADAVLRLRAEELSLEDGQERAGRAALGDDGIPFASSSRYITTSTSTPA
jgi:hypothetical protein